MRVTDKYFTGALTEYKELRAEIRLFLTRRERNLQFALTLTTAVVAAGLQFDNPFLFLLSAILLAFLWYDQIRTIFAVFRIANYIEFAIESRNPGFGWESYGAHHPIQTSIFGRAIANGIFPFMFLVHSVAFFFTAKWQPIWKYPMLLLLAFVFMGLVVISFTKLKHGRHDEQERLANFLGSAKRLKQQS